MASWIFSHQDPLPTIRWSNWNCFYLLLFSFFLIVTFPHLDSSLRFLKILLMTLHHRTRWLSPGVRRHKLRILTDHRLDNETTLVHRTLPRPPAPPPLCAALSSAISTSQPHLKNTACVCVCPASSSSSLCVECHHPAGTTPVTPAPKPDATWKDFLSALLKNIAGESLAVSHQDN